VAKRLPVSPLCLLSLPVDGCIDWSVDLREYHVLAGEPVRVKCALFYSYIRTNYTMATNAKLRLIWYKNKGDAEEPIIFSGHRLSKEDDSIWFRSAEVEDNGFYTCVLRYRICAPGKDFALPWRINSIPDSQRKRDSGSSLGRADASLMTPCESGLLVTIQSEISDAKSVCVWFFLMVVADRSVSCVAGMSLSLDCKAFFGYSGENRRPIIYWKKGEKYVEELAGHIKESEIMISWVVRSLPAVSLADMYRLELAGGLGVILLLLGILTALYKCYNLEIMLCYRRHFGSDEAEDGDGYMKEGSDVTKVTVVNLCKLMDYHHSQDYSLWVFIVALHKHSFSLSPSAYIEDLARSVEQSRRLIIVLTPEFVAKRGWSIFQIETRLHSMLVTGEIKVIMIECANLKNVMNYQEVDALKHTIKVLSVIKWRGPKSNELSSKFWKQVVYEMPAKRKKKTLSRLQVMDSGEQGLFGDLQTTVSTIAMTTTSASLAPPNENRHGHHQVSECRQQFELLPSMSPPLPLPSTVQFSTLGPGGRHVYCNIPMTLLNGQKPDLHLNSTFVPLTSRELSSDIW
uniref:Uncharacterized protein n=1 Tax=Xiphophorus couchianus TaxID=32473 RepID=A0A3B5M305_9TELE